MHILIKAARKFIIFFLGFLVIGIGIILIPLPGPGLLIILAGLAILGIEFEWAKHHHQRVKNLAIKGLEKSLKKLKN